MYLSGVISEDGVVDGAMAEKSHRIIANGRTFSYLLRDGEPKITVTQNDIRAIGAALDMYKLDNQNYPSTQQGLEALVKKPTGNPAAKNWNAEGYLKKLPIDPWGNQYLYLSPGTRGKIDLYSLGADGQEGGDGTNADIGNWDL